MTTQQMRNELARLAKASLSGSETVYLDGFRFANGIVTHATSGNVIAIRSADRSAWYVARSQQARLSRTMGQSLSSTVKLVSKFPSSAGRGYSAHELAYLVDFGDSSLKSWAKHELDLLRVGAYAKGFEHIASAYRKTMARIPLVGVTRSFETELSHYDLPETFSIRAIGFAENGDVRLSTAYGLDSLNDVFGFLDYVSGYALTCNGLLGYNVTMSGSGSSLLVKTGCHTWRIHDLFALAYLVGWHRSTYARMLFSKSAANLLLTRADEVYGQLASGQHPLQTAVTEYDLSYRIGCYRELFGLPEAVAAD